MDTLLADSRLRAELSSRGHAAYVVDWSEEPHLRRYLELIDEARGVADDRDVERIAS
jgi:hypothetical protein